MVTAGMNKIKMKQVSIRFLLFWKRKVCRVNSKIERQWINLIYPAFSSLLINVLPSMVRESLRTKSDLCVEWLKVFLKNFTRRTMRHQHFLLPLFYSFERSNLNSNHIQSFNPKCYIDQMIVAMSHCTRCFLFAPPVSAVLLCVLRCLWGWTVLACFLALWFLDEWLRWDPLQKTRWVTWGWLYFF